MKKKKIIALTSILAFSFFIFSPNVFAEDTLTNQNIINKETSANTTGSENKPNQENKTATNEIKNDKIDNSQNNNIKKENTENKSDTNKIKNNEVDNNVKKENTEDKKVVSEVNNANSATKEANNKAENKDTDKNKVSNPPTSKEIVNSNTKEVNANIPDKNLLAALNKAVGNMQGKNRADDAPIWISDLNKLADTLDLSNKNISNLEGLQYCTSISTLLLTNNNIKSLEPLRNLKNLRVLNLNGNEISDISPISGLTNLEELYLDNNHIEDISSLKGLTKVNKIKMDNQKIKGSEVKSVGPKATVENDIKGVNGEFVDVKNGDGYTYDSGTHEVTYNNINQTGYKSYSFAQQVKLGNASGTFSGTNTQNVRKVNDVVNIPDPRLRLMIIRSFYSGMGGVDISHDNEPITQNMVNQLGEINRCNVDGKVTNIEGIQYFKNLHKVVLAHNSISNISLLAQLPNLQTLWIDDNKISDISPLEGLTKLNDVDISDNKIFNLGPLNRLSTTNLTMKMERQGSMDLPKATIDDGSGEIDNPIGFPATYSKNFNLSITPNGNISPSENGTKISLSNLRDSTNRFNINDKVTLTKGRITVYYSTTLNLPVEHVSTIKVDLPTSMTFDVVTNTIDPKTNRLKPTFVTANYTIKNRGKKPVTIIPSYSVINKGGVDLVESINASDISKNNDVKIAVKLKNLSTDKEIMSVVPNLKGTPFNIGPETSSQLRFEPGVNGMADAEKEQLSDTKSTLGKMIFTISN